MKWLLCQNNSRKRRRFYTAILVYLGLITLSIGGVLLTSGNALAIDKYEFDPPAECKSEWVVSESRDTLSCDNPKMSYPIKGTKELSTCKSEWRRSETSYSPTGGGKTETTYIFECDDPKQIIQTSSSEIPDFSTGRNDSKLQCYYISTAAGDTYYCGGKPGSLSPGGVSEEEKKKIEEEASNTDANLQCYQGSGALGWIICPAVTGLSNIGETMWGYIEDNFMQIQASELFNESHGVVAAWTIVRDIANIVFIILFLCVIFSQVTGIGIDNYGIKKIMPKLIIAAILVNLSYIICELAVDLSNIIGSGIETLLSNFASNVNTSANVATEDVSGAQIMVSAMIGGAGATLFTLLSGGLSVVAIGVAVLSIIFSVVAAIVTLFVILVIREAGIVLLVVIAPLAMACYLLPNTEKLYKKWLDFFKALLMVYPICGAMVGAGKFAGAILATVDSPAMKVAALIVQVLPFFLIPTLLRSSMSIMGNVGAKISGAVNGASRGLSGRAGKTLEGSDTLNHLNNRLGMMSLSKKRRASAFEAEMGRRSSAYRRGRNADRGIMAERLEAAQAEDEAKAQSEDTARRVAYMRRNGIDLEDGSGKKTITTPFNADGVRSRLDQLARKNSLNADEAEEVAALMNAASDMPGGTGAMSSVIRSGTTKMAFMRAAGAAYARDSSVRSKLSGDAGASYYTEQFGPGGMGESGKWKKKDANGNNLKDASGNDVEAQIGDFDDFKNEVSYKYDDQIAKRSPNYQAGLSQSGGEGGALGEYLRSLSPADLRNIKMDDKLLNSIDRENRQVFEEYYNEYQNRLGANNNPNGN